MNSFIRSLVLALAVIVSITHEGAGAAAINTDTLDFSGRLGAIAPENIFRDDGYFVWCGSGINGEDGKFYLFYARWKTGSTDRAPGDEELFKGMKGWLKYSEIAVAVADSPTGPFKHLNVVLRGEGDTNRWDCFTAHNAHVKRFNGKVHLYYTSTRPVPDNDRWMQYANGQRVGVAVADSVRDLAAGKYRRCAEPLMSPDGTNTFCRAVNPSVTQSRDGRYLMMFKSRSAPTGGFMTQWIAQSDKPDGPFQLAGPALNDARYDSEDAFFWFDRARDRYYAVVKDFSRKERGLSPQFGALALITSEKGWGDWRPAAHNLVSRREFTDTEGVKHTLANLERPQFLFDDDGEPICLYAAAGEQNPFQGTPSFNLAIPLDDAAGDLDDKHAYVGSWRGHHVGSQRFGMGTCVLISPNWILTAAHVAQAEANAPETRRVVIRFPGEERRTERAFLAKGADLALARLNRPVTNIAPAAIHDRTLLEKDGKIHFTVVGTSGGRHAYTNETAIGKGEKITHPRVEGSRGGRGGDSGGAWVIKKPGDKNDLLIGIIHGGARKGGQRIGHAVQPAAFRKWVDETLATTGDTARWESWTPLAESKPEMK